MQRPTQACIRALTRRRRDACLQNRSVRFDSGSPVGLRSGLQAFSRMVGLVPAAAVRPESPACGAASGSVRIDAELSGCAGRADRAETACCAAPGSVQVYVAVQVAGLERCGRRRESRPAAAWVVAASPNRRLSAWSMARSSSGSSRPASVRGVVGPRPSLLDKHACPLRRGRSPDGACRIALVEEGATSVVLKSRNSSACTMTA